MSPTGRRGRRGADGRAERGSPDPGSGAVSIGGDSSGVTVTGDNANVRQYQSPSRAVVVTAFVVALAVAASIVWAILGRGPDGSAADDPNHPASTSGAGLSPSDDVQASTTWCLNGNSCPVSNGDYYWSGSAARLNSALAGVTGLNSLSGLSPVGSDQMLITVQSASNESVLLTGLHVVVRHRSPNPGTGLIAEPYCGGCGGKPSVYLFTTSLDDSVPTVRSQDSDAGRVTPGRTGFPLTVSQTDVDVLLLTVDDAHCACTFDLDLTWTIHGKTGHTLLDNGGAHFRIVGSRGLPSYSEVVSGDTRNGVANTSGHSEMIPG